MCIRQFEVHRPDHKVRNRVVDTTNDTVNVYLSGLGEVHLQQLRIGELRRLGEMGEATQVDYKEGDAVDALTAGKEHGIPEVGVMGTSEIFPRNLIISFPAPEDREIAEVISDSIHHRCGGEQPVTPTLDGHHVACSGHYRRSLSSVRI